ncbi:MAG: FtsQ-type POTRA domain-containing protein [Treponema sp.]|jgi:cell division protein FtsQ|nr:FtsQ-type POTRA domain-containing protein [Treponema sp.]
MRVFDEVASRVSIAPLSAEKILKWVLIVAGAVLVGELALVLLVNPSLPLSKIEITGIPELDSRFVLARAGINKNSSYLSVNAHTVERRLKSLAIVESVRVVKHFPDSLSIILVGRRLAALSLASIGNEVTPVFFDRQGTVFMIGSEGLEEATLSMPILSGVLNETPYLGMQLSATLNGLFADLETVRTGTPELLTAFSEIEVNWKAFDAYDLILYPVHSQIRVRLGAGLNADTLRYALLLLDVCRIKRYDIKELDFRTSTAAYTIGK